MYDLMWRAQLLHFVVVLVGGKDLSQGHNIRIDRNNASEIDKSDGILKWIWTHRY